MTETKKLINQTSIFFLLSFLISLGANAEIPADLLKAAEKGDAKAQYSVARSYELGKRVKSDKKKALKWYSKSADQGHLEASYRLGLIYYKGIGGYKTDLEKAFKYLSQAAKGNHKRSQTHLAKMYENGDGVDKSEVLSDYWYEQAFSSKLQSLDEFIKQRGGERTAEPVVQKLEKEIIQVKETTSASVKKNKAKRTTAARFPDFILSNSWSQNGKPSEFMSSTLTSCKNKGKKINCTSGKIKGLHKTGLYKYKVRSIISQPGSANNIQIVYRKLYVSVPEESVGGYDDIDEQAGSGQQLSLGWEKSSHTITCSIESAASVLCRPVGEDAFYIKAQ